MHVFAVLGEPVRFRIVEILASGSHLAGELTALDRVDRALLDLYEKWDRREGWPYRTDPLASPPRRHRLAERARNPVNLHQSEVEPAAPVDQWGWWDDDSEEHLPDSQMPESPHDEAKPA